MDSKYLLEDSCPLCVQSSVNRKDCKVMAGGMGFYIEGAFRLIKSQKPIYEEYERFASAVRDANSKIILAHIRRASNPRELPREKVISFERSTLPV